MKSIHLLRSALTLVILYILADLSFGYFLETKASLGVLMEMIHAMIFKG